MKKTVKDIEVSNKRIILRCDFNVSIKDNVILDDTKIKESLETINYLLEKNCSIVILSHLGKIKSEEDKAQNSLLIVAKRLGELLNTNVIFPGVTRSADLKNEILEMTEKQIMLLENTRYEDLVDKKESNCDLELSQYWASLGEIFVNDAFGSIHRAHASNYGISKFLPSVIGFLVEKEIKNLGELINNPERPWTVIMGGAKVEDKIPLIESIIQKCDYLLLTGGIANTFLKALDFKIGFSLYNKEAIALVQKIMLENKEKIMLPLDAVVGNKYDSSFVRYSLINEIDDNEVIYDIGVKTIEKYKKAILSSKTIFVNGTMGKYEDEKFSNGTRSCLNLLASSNAKVIVGGGDTVSAVKRFDYTDKLTYLSTGGGATLEYLINPNMKVLENIEEA